MRYDCTKLIYVEISTVVYLFGIRKNNLTCKLNQPALLVLPANY